MKKLTLIALFVMSLQTAKCELYEYYAYIHFQVPSFDTSLIKDFSSQSAIYFKKPIQFNFIVKQFSGFVPKLKINYLHYSADRKVTVKSVRYEGQTEYLQSPKRVVSVVMYGTQYDCDFIFELSSITDAAYEKDTVIVKDTVYQFIDTCIAERFVNNYIVQTIDTCLRDTINSDTTHSDTSESYIQSVNANDELNPYVSGHFVMMGVNVERIDKYSLSGRHIYTLKDYDRIFIHSDPLGVNICIITYKGKRYYYKYIKQ
jgi:hypothetical protein